MPAPAARLATRLPVQPSSVSEGLMSLPGCRGDQTASGASGALRYRSRSTRMWCAACPATM